MRCASGHTPQMRLVRKALSTGRPTQNTSNPRSSGTGSSISTLPCASRKISILPCPSRRVIGSPEMRVIVFLLATPAHAGWSHRPAGVCRRRALCGEAGNRADGSGRSTRRIGSVSKIASGLFTGHRVNHRGDAGEDLRPVIEHALIRAVAATTAEAQLRALRAAASGDPGAEQPCSSKQMSGSDDLLRAIEALDLLLALLARALIAHGHISRSPTPAAKLTGHNRVDGDLDGRRLEGKLR